MKFKDLFWVLFISMVPLIELRGAIPVGTLLGLPIYVNYALAVIGNLIPVPFILLLIPKILDFMERFKIFRPIVQWVRKKAVKNSSKIDKDIVTDTEVAEISEPQTSLREDEYCKAQHQVSEMPAARSHSSDKKSMTRSAFIGLMLFVLIPLPGTGAWTGSLVAALFEFPKARSFIAIALGVIGCGLIMSLASYGVLGFLSFLL